MIPKTIHYCWFGRNPKPTRAKKCIRSWRKYCSDYEIIEWNEDNFDIYSCPLYVQQAYNAQKWAFVTDYVRLKVVYDYGGIYLDTDVEVLKSFDNLLCEYAFFGFEYGIYVATGLGFGSEKNNSILREMMSDYENIPFIHSNGELDLIACPVRNSGILVRNGLKLDNTMQKICNCLILPSEYLCPYDGRTKELNVTDNTISIHWYSGSWVPKSERKTKDYYQRKAKQREMFHKIMHIPNRFLMIIIGEERYKKLKCRMGR